MIASFKRAARNGRDAVLAGLVRGRLWPPPGSLTILTYHRVLPRTAVAAARCEPGMYVDPATLDMHLSALAEHFVPIHLREWLQAGAKRRRDRFAAVTFDDGWLDNYEHAYPVLQAHRMPATVFVVVKAADQQIRFWTEELADLYLEASSRPALLATLERHGVEMGALPPSSAGLSALIALLKRFPDSTLQAWTQEARNALPAARRDAQREFLSWTEIEEMARSGVVEFGSHSMSHVRLDLASDDNEIEQEVVGSRAVLERRLGDAFNDVFCYPNGGVGERAHGLVTRTYAAACTTAAGVNRPGTDPFSLRRRHIHEDMATTGAAFRARLV